LRDRNDVTLAEASSGSFWLNGSAWEYPSFENADAFVERLAKQGLIVTDRSVEAALRGRGEELSPRSGQRHFLRATGMTQGTVRQIERARRATTLLQNGAGIVQAVEEAGYYDQAHLTRSLQHFIGQTPAQIVRGQEQLSLLYKTGGR
jgi:methylphosphotriester-DNA--protein-cysteine methyltransferase